MYPKAIQLVLFGLPRNKNFNTQVGSKPSHGDHEIVTVCSAPAGWSREKWRNYDISFHVTAAQFLCQVLHFSAIDNTRNKDSNLPHVSSSRESRFLKSDMVATAIRLGISSNTQATNTQHAVRKAQPKEDETPLSI